jgi:hypothetical protein
MYDNLQKYLDKKNLKVQANVNADKLDALKSEYKSKEKSKALTQAERLDRMEKILRIQ